MITNSEDPEELQHHAFHQGLYCSLNENYLQRKKYIIIWKLQRVMIFDCYAKILYEQAQESILKLLLDLQQGSYRQDCVKFKDFSMTSQTFLLFSRTENLRKILIYTLKFYLLKI